MSRYVDEDDDIFGGSSSQFLSPSRPKSVKSPARQRLNGHRSSASLRGKVALASPVEEEGVNGKHSLAHELAAALMPDTNSGPRSLAEEFGIEYDEGAEGIDESVVHHAEPLDDRFSAGEQGNGASDVSMTDDQALMGEPLSQDPVVDPGSPLYRTKRRPKESRDPMADLSRDLEATDKFLSLLKHVDTDSNATSTTSSLEKVASDVIRHINEIVRDREGQVRELLECEREFRKISGEVGGTEVLGQLAALPDATGLADSAVVRSEKTAAKPLDVVEEEPDNHLNEWEYERDPHTFDESDEYGSEPESPVASKADVSPPLTINGAATIDNTLPYTTHVRTLTTSLVTTLTAISEHAQVNIASSAEAGRKLRALKNKIGGWRTDWDSAEKSRMKVERWEAGLADDDTQLLSSTPGRYSRRVDGRRVVEEHLREFELALAEASTKTRAIAVVA